MRSFFTFIIALAGITQLSAEQRSDKIVIQGNPAGNQTIQIDAAGRTQVEYSYNDRGRGDHITATWKLDAAGVPTEYEGRGNDYMKAPVEEKFDLKNGKAHWKNRSEQGEQSVTGEAFYIPVNAPPEFTGVLARALLKAPGHKLQLLPAGEASIEESGKVSVKGITGKAELIQYRIIGLLVYATNHLARSRWRYGGKRVELVLGYSSSVRRSNTAVARSPTNGGQRLVGAYCASGCTHSKRRSCDPQRTSVRSARS